MMQVEATAHVLIVGRNAAERAFLKDALTLHEDLVGIEANMGLSALHLAKREQIRSTLIDGDLPDIDGRDLCRLMRRRGIKIPIILLSAQDKDADVILGLDSGASDYVVKPFRTNVLLARLRAQHRYFEQLDDAVFAIGPYAFRPSTKILTDRKTARKIHLTNRESAILKCLYRLGGRPAQPNMLLGEVWGRNAAVSPHALETQIYRLRKKLESAPNKLQLLVTEPEGYRLVR
jgi:DNA-binding response OmpR family regulator